MNGFVAARAMDDFMRLVFGSKSSSGCRKILLEKQEALHAVCLLNIWLEKYYHLALDCYQKGLCFYNLTPKYHYLCHVSADMELQLQKLHDETGGRGIGFILNPAIFSTQMAEDHVGRLSRTSRTCHPTTASLRTAQKWLIISKAEWSEELT